jgi:hypothetical protein
MRTRVTIALTGVLALAIMRAGAFIALAPPLPFLIAGGLTALAAGAAAWEGAARRTP